MSVRFKKIFVLSLLILLVLAAVPMSVNAGTKIGTSFVISANPEEEEFPSVAYNSTRQEYLVVWFNDRPLNDDIRAQRLTKDGLKIGPPFYISAGPGNARWKPDVAYNSQHDQYLVVWENKDTTTGYKSIRAKRVSGTGDVLDSTEIILDSGSNQYTPETPVVAYASTSDRYMVVWAGIRYPKPITYTIYAQKVTGTGGLEGMTVTLAQDTAIIEEPDIAYNRHANRHLVVWQRGNEISHLWEIKGRQVKGDGGTYSTEIWINNSANNCMNPAVASIPTSGGVIKFLVVFEVFHAVGDQDIYGRFIEEDGTINVMIAPGTSTKDETHPAVAGNEAAQEYFVVWEEDVGSANEPIKGTQYSSSGVSLGTYYQFPGPRTKYPAIAAGHMADFLIAWQDQPVFGTHMNIYAQLFGNREFLPLFMKKP